MLVCGFATICNASAGTCPCVDRHMSPAGNSINLSQLTKRAHKLGYHTYVGKGMVLICAAANTKGKLAEDGSVTVRSPAHDAVYACDNIAITVKDMCSRVCRWKPMWQHTNMGLLSFSMAENASKRF